MVFFTGKGDKGTTQVFDSRAGVRVSKAAPVFECLGQLDELNATIGWACVACPQDLLVVDVWGSEILRGVQDHLFTIQAEAAGAQKSVPQEGVERISKLIHDIEFEVPAVNSFLILGQTEFSARLDIARAIARRAERRLVTLHESGERAISEGSRAYMNRLSSLLYALIRLANHRAGLVEHAPRYPV